MHLRGHKNGPILPVKQQDAWLPLGYWPHSKFAQNKTRFSQKTAFYIRSRAILLFFHQFKIFRFFQKTYILGENVYKQKLCSEHYELYLLITHPYKKNCSMFFFQNSALEAFKFPTFVVNAILLKHHEQRCCFQTFFEKFQ